MAGKVWKYGTRRGIAYVENRATAEQVMQLSGRHIEAATAKPSRRGAAAAVPAETALNGAMAVYLDRKGRPFAWQIPFDIGYWEQVTAVVGVES